MKTLLAILLATAVALPAFAAPGDGPFRHDADVRASAPSEADTTRAELLIKHGSTLAPGTLILTMEGAAFVLQAADQPAGKAK